MPRLCLTNRFAGLRAAESSTKVFAFKEEDPMYLTDIIWWGYTAFVVVLALFMLFFAYKVRERGE
jgi:hypothetical protein